VRLVPRILLAGVLIATLGAIAASPPATAGGACGHPVFTTRAPYGYWNGSGYTVSNDVWNGAGHHVRQRLSVCGPASWYADTRLPRRTDDEVKSYPNAHVDFGEPRLSAFRALRVSWASRLPQRGRWDAAWDVWLDGRPGKDAGVGRKEVMVWTDGRGSVPLGHPVGSARFAGRHWQVWRARGLAHPYVAFVPSGRIARGSLDLMRPLRWLLHRHWVRSHVTLGQAAYGFEVVATHGRRLHFATTGLSIHGVRR